MNISENNVVKERQKFIGQKEYLISGLEFRPKRQTLQSGKTMIK